MANDSVPINFRRGLLPLVVLSLLESEDMYGYQLVQEAERRSGGAIVTQEGSLYPVLYKLLETGLITDRRMLAGKRMTRVYYHLEDAGRPIWKPWPANTAQWWTECCGSWNEGMDMNGTDTARRYLGDVRARLPMRHKEKQRVMTQLALHVSEYTYAFPESGYADLQERFGAPEEVSAMYVDSRDAEELSIALNLRERIWKLFVSAAAVLVLLSALVSGYVVWHVHSYGYDYVVIDISREDQPVMGVDARIPGLNEFLTQT